jgi:hypothetical protein
VIVTTTEGVTGGAAITVAELARHKSPNTSATRPAPRVLMAETHRNRETVVVETKEADVRSPGVQSTRRHNWRPTDTALMLWALFAASLVGLLAGAILGQPFDLMP